MQRLLSFLPRSVQYLALLCLLVGFSHPASAQGDAAVSSQALMKAMRDALNGGGVSAPAPVATAPAPVPVNAPVPPSPPAAAAALPAPTPQASTQDLPEVAPPPPRKTGTLFHPQRKIAATQTEAEPSTQPATPAAPAVSNTAPADKTPEKNPEKTGAEPAEKTAVAADAAAVPLLSEVQEAPKTLDSGGDLAAAAPPKLADRQEPPAGVGAAKQASPTQASNTATSDFSPPRPLFSNGQEKRKGVTLLAKNTPKNTEAGNNGARQTPGTSPEGSAAESQVLFSQAAEPAGTKADAKADPKNDGVKNQAAAPSVAAPEKNPGQPAAATAAPPAAAPSAAAPPAPSLSSGHGGQWDPAPDEIDLGKGHS